MSRLTQKELTLTTLTGLLSVMFYGSFVWLLKVAPAHWFWYGAALLGVVSISVLMITIALIQHRALRWATSFLPALAVAAFGWPQPSALAGAGLLAIVTLIAAVTTRDHLDDYVRLQPRRAFWTGSQLVAIGTIAALAGLYFPVLANQLQAGDVQLQERTVEPFLRPLAPVFENLLPNSTQGHAFNQVLNSTLAQPLPPAIQQELNRRLSEAANRPSNITALTTQWLNNQLSQFATESPLLVSLVILVPIFFTSWFLSPVLLWPVVMVITGLLWLFRRLYLVQIESHPEPVDHLTLS